jgi:hypothetical protein
MGQDSERLACAMFWLDAGEVLLRHRMVSEDQDGGFGQGPLQMRLAALGA